MSVEERVIEIVSEQMGVSKDQVTKETSFVNDLGADSLDTVELVMEFEEEFDITIPDEEAEKIQTVGQAIDYIEQHGARQVSGLGLRVNRGGESRRERCSSTNDGVLTISRTMAHPRRVVITGMGVVTSLGDSLDRFWSALCAGQSGVGPLTLFDTTEFKVHFGGQVRDWDPVGPVRRQGSAAPRSLCAVRAGGGDLGRRGFRESISPRLPAEHCGVFIGSGIGGLNEFETQHTDDDAEGAVADQPVRDSQADGQRRQRPGLDSLGTARARARRWRRRAPRRPTRSATPTG